MSQYYKLDLINVLNHCTNTDILKMTEVCLTSEWLKQVVISQPESVLARIREDFKLSSDYEVAELIHRLNSIELSDVLKKYLHRSVMMDQLTDINPDTRDALINYKMNEERKKFVAKLENAKRIFDSDKNNYEKIFELLELNTPKVFISVNKEKSTEYRDAIVSMINDLVKLEIETSFGDRFLAKMNGKKTNKKLPDNINIRNVHGNSVVFDFYVKKGKQEVTFNGNELHEANHFFVLWIGDFMGFEDSERLKQLYAINAKSLIPFMDDLYLYDSIFWDGTEVCGVLNNQGDVILPSKFSQIERIGFSDYFKANRLKLHGEIEGEGWEYYDKNGRRVNGELIEGEFDEKYHMDLINKYRYVKEIIWTEKELNHMKTIGQKKFSKWFESFDELKDLTETIMIDYKTVYRNPNIKHYIVNDFYVCFSNLNGKEMVGVGIDPDLNVDFNFQEE
ncbi:MAG: hypothetical protein J0L69_09930 [Bacteroidetes bacterium]|nr:hypothetical protein [Bacteroidota bacterium]